MEDIKVTLLSEKQCIGEIKLDILKKYGTKCSITDFSILLGGYVSSYDYTSERETIKERTGCWWVKNIFPFTKYRFIKLNGFLGGILG